jgi:hypothetical protein
MRYAPTRFSPFRAFVPSCICAFVPLITPLRGFIGSLIVS